MNSLRQPYLNDPDALHGFVTSRVVFRVKFRKKDGSFRSLLGTVHPDLIPPEKQPEGEGNPNYEEAIPVYDLEKQEWRSFKPSHVLDIYSI